MKTKKLFVFCIMIIANFSLFSQRSTDISGIFYKSQRIISRSDDFLSEGVYLKLKKDKLKSFYRSNLHSIKLVLPISPTDSAVLLLEDFKLLTDDFLLKTSSGKVISNYKRGKFYRGSIKNKNGFATINFFENEVSGIITISGIGNFNFGKLKGSRDEYIIYNDRKTKINLGIACQITDDYDMGKSRSLANEDIKFRSNCVKFYLEGDYALYQDKGSVSNTADYMTSLFAEMATLYSNEQIDIEIKEMMIWTSADGYDTNSSSNALDQFMANNPDKNADLCHLFALGGNNTGGLAWIDVLCNDTYKFAYSNVSSTYQTVPTYSWSVECITHETGHNFGSKHTHDCVWGTNNDEQIDDCGPESGNPGNPGDCYDSDNPKLPNKGTIMSYCHLIGSIGIDFNLGFGQEPGDLIRANYANAACLTDCEASSTCDIPVNLTVINLSGTTATLDWEIGASGSKWEVEYGLAGFSLGTGTNMSNITNTYLNLTGLDVAKTYDWYIRTDCGNGDFSNWVGPKQFTTICVGPSAIILPFIEDWESGNGTIQNDGYISCDVDKNWYFETTDQGYGRAQWGTDCNWPITGNGSLVMDRYPNGNFTTNTSTLTLDMSSYSSSNDLQFKFKYMDLGDESDPEDKVWVRGTDSDTWVEAYDLDPGSIPNQTTVQVSIDLDNVLANESQNVGSTFQIKFGQRDNYSAAPNNDGIVFDDIEVIDCNDNIQTVPYETDFSVDIDCWSVEDLAKDNYTWKLTSGSSCDENYFGLEYEGSTSPSVDMDDWLFSPGIQLTNGASYRLSFSLGDGGLNEKLEVYLSDENSSTDALNGYLLFRDESIDNFNCKESIIDFTAPSTGVFYIGFHGYSDDNSHHYLYIDDFKIDDTPDQNSITIESNTDNTCDDYAIDGVAGDTWHNIYSYGNIVAAINPNNQTLGTVTIQMRDGGPVETYNINGNDVKSIPRYFNIESENTFVNDVTIRLYLLDAELSEYNSTPPISSDAISDLQINHYDGAGENCDWSDNDDDGNTIVQADISTGSINTNDYYMEFDVSSFSEFLIRQDGASTLPLKYDISAKRKGELNRIELFLYEYSDIEKLIFQRKNESSGWSTLNTFDCIKDKDHNYSIEDNSPSDLSYYRVVFVSFDGIKSYSKIVSINIPRDFSIENIYPNPTNGFFTIKLQTKSYETVKISIKNILGKQVYQDRIYPKSQKSLKNINLKELDNGVYFIAINQGATTIVKKLVVE